MTLMRGQSDISSQVPMPTDRVDDASTVTAVSGETLTWFYVTSSAWASATGQAAGTLVHGKLAFDGVLNSNKAAVGSFNNTSLSFGAATRFDVKVSIPEDVLSRMQFLSPTDQKAEALKFLTTNGYYAIDHRRGQIWGLAKATVADDSMSYSYRAPVAGSGGPSSNVAVTAVVPGTGATNLGKAEDAAHTSGDVGVAILGKRTDTPASSAGTDGDYATVNQDSLGHGWTREGYAAGFEDNSVGVAKVEQQMSYTNITLAAPTTTVVKSGAGFLHALVINTPAATGVITIYDNTAASGTIIGTITQPAALLDGVGKSIIYNVKFTIGLTIVTSTAAQNLTVASR